jgi:3-hydroxyisobutyrate dehydrogenase-like beta-hydroxyacid dehydrogenase
VNVGFIGLGRMGQGMARRILSGGHNLTVHDAVMSQVADIVAAGAIAAPTVADACNGQDVVVTMLVEDAVVTDVALRAGGIRDSP